MLDTSLYLPNIDQDSLKDKIIGIFTRSLHPKYSPEVSGGVKIGFPFTHHIATTHCPWKAVPFVWFYLPSSHFPPSHAFSLPAHPALVTHLESFDPTLQPRVHCH